METLEAEFEGNESVLDRLTDEQLSDPNFDFWALADDLGITKDDVYNSENDLAF